MSDSVADTDEQFETLRNAFIDELVMDIIDDVTCGLCFEIHRACKLGILFLDETDPDTNRFEIVNKPGLDIFGQPRYIKKQYECVCPNCQRTLAASRFAPHLEKCMGMGRISSRIASKRIANNSGKKGSDVDSDAEDNSNDANYVPDRKSKKLKRDKHVSLVKRTKSSAKLRADSPSLPRASDTLSGSQPHFHSLSLDEKKNLMVHTCCVISEHTHKMCTRSLKCPQHSAEQRRAVREHFLGPIPHSASASVITIDDEVVDVDTCDSQSSDLVPPPPLMLPPAATAIPQLSWNSVVSISSLPSATVTRGSSLKRHKRSHKLSRSASTSAISRPQPQPST